jgi:hypothetical protein
MRGILNSNDMTTGAPVILYDNVTQEVITLSGNDIFVIYLISVCNGDSAAVVEVFDDKDADLASDPGETLFKKSMNAKEQAGLAYTRGFAISRAPVAKASAASANSSVIVYGDLQR